MRRVVASSMIGNGLEWYDFALYGIFAPIIFKPQYFPSDNYYAGMLATYGVFAMGFLMRPIGAVMFGYIGDHYGRKFALMVSILLMAIPTACIGLLPNYEQIGIWAPILLTVIRLLQGLSLGGEFSGSIVFVVEHAPIHKRGYAGSSSIMSLCGGMLLGLAVATFFSKIMSQQDFESWGWRIPFLLGIAIAFVGAYIRHHTDESPHYEKAKQEDKLSKTPLREALQQHPLSLLRGIGLYLCVTVPFYILTVYLNEFLTHHLGYPKDDTLFVMTLSMTLLMFMVPVTGKVSDKFGRKRVLMATTIAYFVCAYPLFLLMIQPGFANALTAIMILTVIVSFYIGPAPTMLVELFPTSVRYTGMAVSYNICAALFGGTAPMVVTWLIKDTQMLTVPALYIMLCAVLSFISFIGYHDRYREELH